MIGINIKKLLHIVNTKVIMDQILMINVVFKNLEVLAFRQNWSLCLIGFSLNL